MARPSEGWRFRDRKSSDECWSIRFSHGGKQYSRGTGETDKTRAAKEAERIYLAVVSGTEGKRAGKRQRQSGTCRPLGPASADWIGKQVNKAFGIDTAKSYIHYFKKHFIPHFETVEGITDASVAALVEARLRLALAKTVKKELGCLRAFCAGVQHPVAIPFLGKKVKGTPTPRRIALESTELSPAEVQAVFAACPEKDRYGQWFRARYEIAYETSLRPRTLDTLSVPQNYRKGADSLKVTTDKTGFVRTVPLSARARVILDEICPERGRIFGRTRHGWKLKRIAKSVLGPRGESFHPYDLRAQRITHLLEHTGNLPGVQWLAGHKHMSTTSKYVKASHRAAVDALKSAEISF